MTSGYFVGVGQRLTWNAERNRELTPPSRDGVDIASADATAVNLEGDIFWLGGLELELGDLEVGPVLGVVNSVTLGHFDVVSGERGACCGCGRCRWWKEECSANDDDTRHSMPEKKEEKGEEMMSCSRPAHLHGPHRRRS